MHVLYTHKQVNLSLLCNVHPCFFIWSLQASCSVGLHSIGGKRREDEGKEKMRVEGGWRVEGGGRGGGGISPVSAFHLTLSYIHSYIAQACPEQ